MNWERHRITFVVVLLAVAPLIFFQEGATYASRIFTLFLMYAVLAMALNIVFGHTDQLLLFTGAITGIGAYSAIVLAETVGISLWVMTIPAAVIAGVVGYVTCYVSARQRLTVIVISIVTLAMQLGIIETFNGLTRLTGGDTGRRIPATGIEPYLESFGVPKLTFLYYAFLVLLTAVLIFYRYLMRSEYGLAFEVIRQDEFAAEATGVAVVRYKALAGFIATFIMGLVGPLYIQVEGFAFPGMFGFAIIDVLVLIVLVVGGLRTMYGPIAGAAVMIYINEQLQQAAQFRRMTFGLLLLFLFLYFRSGIVPYVDRQLEDRFEYKQRLSELG